MSSSFGSVKEKSALVDFDLARQLLLEFHQIVGQSLTPHWQRFFPFAQDLSQLWPARFPCCVLRRISICSFFYTESRVLYCQDSFWHHSPDNLSEPNHTIIWSQYWWSAKIPLLVCTRVANQTNVQHCAAVSISIFMESLSVRSVRSEGWASMLPWDRLP